MDMDFFSLIKKRESCRAYLEQPVEKEKLIACMEAVQLAPSACNSQPWRMILVDDPEQVRAFAPVMQGGLVNVNRFTAQIPAFIVLAEGSANLSSKLGGRFKNQEFAEIDLGIAASYLTLAATEQGLGSCIMGWLNETSIKKLLKIPASVRVRLVIGIGYPKETQPREKTRKKQEEIMNTGTWKETWK